MVESNEGTGTTFRIILPACTAPGSGDEMKKEENLMKPPLTSTVLVIDDEEDVATMAQEMLKTQKHTALIVLNPILGIELYKQHQSQIDLVLLDLTMPEMSGKEVMDALLAINPSVKIIISSGYSAEEMINKIGTQKASAFIQKPYRMEALLTTVQRVIQ